MLLAGDEFCRTQNGNNNAYCQDNEISWVNWELKNQHDDMVRFTRLIIAFRRRHYTLRRQHFFSHGPGISWHGERIGRPDWSGEARWLAFMLEGRSAAGRPADPEIYVMLNGSEQERHFEVPYVGKEWLRMIDTARPSPEDIFETEEQAASIGQHPGRYRLPPRSVVVLVAR
jgi:glycogen operon protein